jgi:hypothetical protein
MADTGLEEIIIVHESYKVSQAAILPRSNFSDGALYVRSEARRTS